MEKLFGATNGEDMYHDIMYIYICWFNDFIRKYVDTILDIKYSKRLCMT